MWGPLATEPKKKVGALSVFILIIFSTPRLARPPASFVVVCGGAEPSRAEPSRAFIR